VAERAVTDGTALCVNATYEIHVFDFGRVAARHAFSRSERLAARRAADRALRERAFSLSESCPETSRGKAILLTHSRRGRVAASPIM